ncbi:MAG: hypothetical protein M1838_002892 [Thelocarpon superellum]|nr:MAG: hypothetical protein M1838_002892 [Thelocarpon superellum]
MTMAALRPPSLRHIITVKAPFLRGWQRRWAQVHDVRFLATHHEPDRILEKYKAKLDRKAKEEGLKDVNELKEAYKDKIARLRREAKEVELATAAEAASSSSSSSSSSSPFPSPPGPPNPAPSASPPPPSASRAAPDPAQPGGIKPLSSYIDIHKTLSLPPREIEYIWRLRHASSPTSLCAVIPTPTYNRLASTARRHPQFILPLPREGQGAEIHFLQWTFPSPTTSTVLFTHLAEYKLRGEYSQPHTTITHHLDLAEPKGLVLLQGNVLEGRGVSVEEGKWLLMCLQKFYGVGVEGEREVAIETEEAAKRQKLLESFSQGDASFNVEELLEEAEKVS